MGFDKEHLKSRIEQNMLEFVAVKSHTNSRDERHVGDYFEKWFKTVPYLVENSDNCGLFPIPGDHLDRVVSWSLLKGKGKKTIVLIHHCDTVETKDYQLLEPLSLKPLELIEAFKAGKMEMPPQVKADLDSGDWIFGRGVADMKGGGALYMALFEEYSKDKDFNGNIVLLSLPDEENLSAGAIGASYLLKELKAKHNLEYVLTMDSECHEREVENQTIFYDGSIGKILPVVYARGKLAHGGLIYKGLNPINLLSEIIRRTELNPVFMEKVGNTVSPPPSWQYHKDRKLVYDVSIPIGSSAYMNILPLVKSPKEIMECLKSIAIESFDKVIEDMNASYAQFLEKAGNEPAKLPWKTNVKFYSEIYQEALRDSGSAFEEAIKETLAGIKTQFVKGELSIINGANAIIEKTLEYVKDLSPVVIISMAPPYYPSVNNSMIGDKAEKVQDVFEKAMKFTKDEFGLDTVMQSFYTGISDLSYAMFTSGQDVIDYIEANMLMWKDIYYMPLDVIKEISMPVMNIGPWGKDIHKYSERVYAPDLYYHTPYITDFIIKNMLD